MSLFMCRLFKDFTINQTEIIAHPGYLFIKKIVYFKIKKKKIKRIIREE